jgi:anti-sigma regulatory factor (Ser/Thr protein kinase)
VQVSFRTWDLAEKAVARQLDQIEPAWSVWYGVGARCFYAAATWQIAEPLLIQARTVEELRDLMREVESPLSSSTQPRADQPVQPSRARVRTSPSPRGAPMLDTPDGLRTVCWDLPDNLWMIGKTRRLVNDVLINWGMRSLADDVVIVVGELLANAVTYGEPPIRLSLWAGNDGLCVRVTDHGPDQPRVLDLGVEAVHGRGLAIVATLAHDYGITRTANKQGKTVWARWGSSVRNAENAGVHDF